MRHPPTSQLPAPIHTRQGKEGWRGLHLLDERRGSSQAQGSLSRTHPALGCIAQLRRQGHLPQPFRYHPHRWHGLVSQGEHSFVTGSRNFETPCLYSRYCREEFFSETGGMKELWRQTPRKPLVSLATWISHGVRLTKSKI